MSLNAAARLADMFEEISAAIAQQKDLLTELDGAIGDGDHGITMSIGFSAVTAHLTRLDLSSMSAGELMRAAASAFLNAVGASTGPLYATGFRRAADALSADKLELEDAAAMIVAITTGIRERGKGDRGEKTMLDAWYPAAEAAQAAMKAGKDPNHFWRVVVEAAEAGAQATRSMLATKGRASRVGERAIGHIDPGAASAVIILKAMSRALN